MMLQRNGKARHLREVITPGAGQATPRAYSTVYLVAFLLVVSPVSVGVCGWPPVVSVSGVAGVRVESAWVMASSVWPPAPFGVLGVAVGVCGVPPVVSVS